MNFLEGLKTIWSVPEILKTAIKSTVATVTRAATRKQRKANEAYLAEPKTTMVDGELYKKMPGFNDAQNSVPCFFLYGNVRKTRIVVVN